MMKNFISKNKKLVFGLFAMLILLIGGTYAWYTITLEGKKTVKVHSGTLSLEIDEEASEGISIEDAYPMTDEEGLEGNSYNFKLTNDGNIPSNYVVSLEDMEIDSIDPVTSNPRKRMSNDVVKFNLEKTSFGTDGTQNGDTIETRNLLSTLGEDKVLDRGILQPNESVEYSLKLWMDYRAGNDSQRTAFKTRVKVDGEQIKE